MDKERFHAFPMMSKNITDFLNYYCKYDVDRKKMWKYYKCRINTKDIKNLFIHSCEHNHIDVTRLIWRLYKHKLNDSHTTATAFRTACCNGYLKLSKWLWSNNIYLNITNTHIQSCCHNKHFELAKWLCDIYLDNRIKTIKNHRITLRGDVGSGYEKCSVMRELNSRNNKIITRIKKDKMYEQNDRLTRFTWCLIRYGISNIFR